MYVAEQQNVLSLIWLGMERFHFISGNEANLSKKPLLSVDYNTSEGGTGHPGFICHKQPILEKAIRDTILASQYSQLRSQCTVTAIGEDVTSVTVQYNDKDGRSTSIQAPFLVGADGKTGFVRKKYLEPKGVLMQKCEGYVIQSSSESANGKRTNYEETWVALNWKINLPTEKTHPNFPLWQLGYTPEEVFDFFFPRQFRFLCNPDRPSVCGRFGLLKDRLWRFEFVVHEGEDGMEMASMKETKKIIFPYITHPGSRYGLQHAVAYPEDCIETLRSRPFSFSARSCNKWSLGRVIVAGDAAHVFPPFGGQGIASGFRDAFALAWRLQYLHLDPTADHVRMLRAWYLERKQQLERSLAATIQNGEYVTERQYLKVFIRDWSLWFQQLIPAWKRELERGPRANGMTRYTYHKDLSFQPSGGLLLPQVYTWDSKASQVVFSDDLLFSTAKKGLLQLLVLPQSTEEAVKLLQELKQIQLRDRALLEEATVLIQSVDASALQSEEYVTVRSCGDWRRIR